MYQHHSKKNSKRLPCKNTEFLPSTYVRSSYVKELFLVTNLYRKVSIYLLCFYFNYNFTPSPSSDSHCESPTSQYAVLPHQMSASSHHPSSQQSLHVEKNGSLSPPPLKQEEYRIPSTSANSTKHSNSRYVFRILSTIFKIRYVMKRH